ncbi:glycosyl hydrolases family 2, TIM barrel domain-containing protein [Scheffersomyces coipomensis]|uniref:glycosyl hydrolases family 2, TIM barrel domain-containing protein n=1 Tax=Scheffersomyces coipomensis TaxID=1788519 RepID=UPI00315CC3E4
MVIDFTDPQLTNCLSNPAIVQTNRLEPRAYYLPLESTLSLNGVWDFRYDEGERATGKEDNFFNSSIAVPGHWQLSGFGKPHYTNVQYPFPVDPPHPPSQNPVGTYRRYFTVPVNWNSEDFEYRIRFEGVDNSYHVFLNGKLLGYNEGSRNAAEFDISKLISRQSPNELIVRVYQWSSSSYIEDQDQWWLSGIFRDVYLLGFNKSGYIKNFQINTDLDNEYRDSNLEINLSLNKPSKFQINLFDNESELIIQEEYDGDINNQITIPVPDPTKWTAETPDLYKLVIDIIYKDKVVSSVTQEVGFRKVEMKDGLIQVNGRPILLRGVNRHDHHPKYGRAVPLDFILRDLLIMKRHNINAIRTSHYPNHPKFYELTNRLGFWVLDEADLECHGFYQALSAPLDLEDNVEYDEPKLKLFKEAGKFTSDNKDWEVAYVDRANQLVNRDFNQPSVIIWSLGNESFLGCNHAKMAERIRSVDFQKRPIHYEGDLDAVIADMYSRMYTGIKSTENYANQKEKPLILCEYGHAMGNGPGLLKQYQELFYKHDNLQGGFIWEWANHGLEVINKDGGKTYYYGGDFGDKPNDGVFIMDGLVNSVHDPTPGLIEYKKVIEPIVCTFESGKLRIKNTFDFINLDHYIAFYTYTGYDCLEEHLLQIGEIELPKIKSKQEVLADIPILTVDTTQFSKVIFDVQFKTKEATNALDMGHTVAWSQLEISLQEWEVLPSNVTSAIIFENKHNEVKIITDKQRLVFNKIEGRITSWCFEESKVQVSEEDIIPPSNLNFWRPCINNDEFKNAPYWRRFGLHCMKKSIRNVDVKQAKNENGLIATFIVESHIAPPTLAWGFKSIETYLIYDGQIDKNIELIAVGDPKLFPDTLPRFGYEFTVNDELGDKIRWFGRGPGESYPDKKESQKIGIHRSTLAEINYNYDFPQENGNHEDTEMVLLEDNLGKMGLLVSSKNKFGFKFSNEENLEEAKHPNEIIRGKNRYVRIDYKQHGVGTAACGPQPLPEFQFHFEPMIEFYISLKFTEI